MRVITKVLYQNLSYALRSPINIELLKSEEGKMALQSSLRARFKNEEMLTTLHHNYEAFRKHLYEFQALNKNVNDLQKEIKSLVKSGQKERLQSIKLRLLEMKQAQSGKDKLVKQSKAATEQMLLVIGNGVHPNTVVSKDQQQNKILKYYIPKLPSPLIPDKFTNHQQIVSEYFAVSSLNHNPQKTSYQDLNNLFQISDLTRGQKVSGHRGYFLCGNGVKLAQGIAQYGLEFLQKRGYDLYQTPALILEDVLRDSCQLNTINTDMYRFSQDKLCLIATSQQTLAGYYRGETLQGKRLPLRMGGYSSCFRREAGAHGKDIHGLFRLHQFQKIQQFVICHPSESHNEMQRMIKTSQEFYQSLNIPYRIVDIVSGELNDPAYRKVDLEAWFPSQGKFRELVSISNCTDYQSRLLETKFREGTSTLHPHMLNGTLVAIQRAITCFLQHFYHSESQKLQIPKPLQPFVRAQYLSRPK